MLLTQKLTSTYSLDRKDEELLLQVYEKGEEINLFDTGLWQVHRGIVQLSRFNYQGKEAILGWATPSMSFFGNWLQDSSANRAVALSDVYLKWYTPKDIERSAILKRYLLEQFSDRLMKFQQLLAIAGQKRVEDRLWQLLLMLKQEMSQITAEGARIKIRFTHQSLADIICTTRVTVTRILGELQTRGWIVIDCDRHIILKEVSGSEL